MDIAGFVPKAENALIFLRQIAEKSGIQEKWVIPIVTEILPLDGHIGIVIIEEHGLSFLAYWNTLTVNTGGVKEES